MARVELPFPDSKYTAWLTNFAMVAEENASELNLTPEQTDAITALADEFSFAFRSNIAAKQYAKGQSSNKRRVRSESEQLIRSTAKLIAVNGAISQDLKSKLGLRVTTRSSSPVEPVQDVCAFGFAHGTNKIKWKRCNNIQGTSFIVEASYDGSGRWEYVGMTTQCKYLHEGQVPGKPVLYRVISQRAGKQSAISNLASVYSDYRSHGIEKKVA